MSALALVGLTILSVALLLSGLLFGAVCLSVLYSNRRHMLADQFAPLILLMFSVLMVVVGCHGLRGVSTALVGS
ncbi:hypothetical protein CBQ26_00800 [Deinococcus indicus]|uniref:Uncharacterized protein n=1 Tax=Deinococcus indicus TaxID=223556 RepID=A0A246BTP1_9DEIO|nr:hypothetical protein [Deinococcus indicus]OWL99031.1 hypothetical protein CBQ26_00800 [Deinococcus indicus]